MTSEELQDVAFQAEDEGKEVYVQRHGDTEIIEYIEIDGEEIENDSFEDEVEHLYSMASTYRIAESSWRE